MLKIAKIQIISYFFEPGCFNEVKTIFQQEFGQYVQHVKDGTLSVTCML